MEVSGVMLKQVSDENGECRFTQLIPGEPYSLSIVPAGGPLIVEPEQLVFQPGEFRQMDYRLQSLVSFRGQLTDETGAPISGREIWLRRSSSKERLAQLDGYFSPWEGANIRRPDRKDVTDSTGRFAFNKVPPGYWSVGPGAGPWGGFSASGQAPPTLDGPSMAKRIEIVEGEPVQEVRLSMAQDLFIEGRVLDLEQLGASGIHVNASRVGSEGGTLSVRSNKNGEFRIGPLLPGDHELTLSGLAAQGSGGGACVPETSVHPAGSSGVLLQLQLGCELICILSGLEPGTPREVEIVLQQDGSWRRQGLRSSSTDGRYAWSGLRPGSWSVLATDSLGNTWAARSVLLDPGSSPRSVTLQPTIGGWLHLENEGLGDEIGVRVLQGGAQLGSSPVLPGGSLRMLLPPGDTIVVSTSASGEERAQPVRITANRESTLVLGKAP